MSARGYALAYNLPFAFWQDLNFLTECYLEPLKQETSLSIEEIEQLFGNIQEIVQFQRQFLQSLEEAIDLQSDFMSISEPKQFRVSVGVRTKQEKIIISFGRFGLSTRIDCDETVFLSIPLILFEWLLGLISPHVSRQFYNFVGMITSLRFIHVVLACTLILIVLFSSFFRSIPAHFVLTRRFVFVLRQSFQTVQFVLR